MAINTGIAEKHELQGGISVYENIFKGDDAESLIAGYSSYTTAEEVDADMADQAPANTPSVVVTSTIAMGC